MNSEFMPVGGVKELVKTAEGRRYLARLQKKYELDIIQPGDPRFEKVWGHKRKQFQVLKEKHEKQYKEEWQELREKKEFVKRKGGTILVERHE